MENVSMWKELLPRRSSHFHHVQALVKPTSKKLHSDPSIDHCTVTTADIQKALPKTIVDLARFAHLVNWGHKLAFVHFWGPLLLALAKDYITSFSFCVFSWMLVIGPLKIVFQNALEQLPNCRLCKLRSVWSFRTRTLRSFRITQKPK